jgi:TRAP-type C4-dicarboxylate transport system permease large subunit
LELFLLILMIALILALVLAVKLPVGISLLLTAAIMALIGTHSLPLSNLVMGMFSYLDTCMLLVTAMIFMSMIERNGLLARLIRDLLATFGGNAPLLLIVLTLIVMFPGAITGSCTASVLGTGIVVIPILQRMNIPNATIGALIATASVYGMIAPPINVMVMTIGGGIDMPYIGFGKILFLISVPLAILSTFYFAYSYARKADLKAIIADVKQQEVEKGILIYLPLIALVLLMVLPKMAPMAIPDLGLPVTFTVACILAMFTGKKFNIFESAKVGTNNIIGVVGILFGVGALIEIMTMTGVKGEIVALALSLPPYLKLPAMAISLPLFGGVSVYGSASVLGVPFTLANIGGNSIIIASAISLIASIGSFIPPVALTSVVAAQLLGEKSYVPISMKCIVPWTGALIIGLLMLVFSNQVAAVLL